MGLALDIGLGCLALVVEGVKILVEAMIGRDPGVDGAAQPLDSSLCPERCRTHRHPSFVRPHVHPRVSSLGLAQAKEARSVPARARDGTRHLRQAFVGAAVPGKAILQHHDAVKRALPFAH